MKEKKEKVKKEKEKKDPKHGRSLVYLSGRLVYLSGLPAWRVLGTHFGQSVRVPCS